MRTLLIFLCLTASAMALDATLQSNLCVVVGSVTNSTGLDAAKIRKALLVVSVVSTSNRLDVTTRNTDLVFAEKDLNGYAALRGFNATNSIQSIWGTYSNLVANAATPEAASDLMLESRTVENAKLIILNLGGDYSGSSLRSNTVSVATYSTPLWTGPLPTTQELENCFPRIPVANED